ncbi:lysozyme inhibitor LprI family protein [Paenibacillus sp. DYY-L-2]|uniref:lysozyme inhibitor LprI family protein n=1 Tax=Paenibacillus sp. DYY-L-2 TaxID=3447013 RepID=UPI003F4F48D8
MKKTGSLFLSVILVSGILAGCGNSGKPDQTGNTTGNDEAVQTEQNTQGHPATEGTPPAGESGLSDGKGTADGGTKKAYIQKLDDIEKGLSDLQELYDEGTTVSMTKAAEEAYKRWDDALNEIYGALKNRLTEEDMAVLKKEQQAWITKRDEDAEKKAAEFKGGTMEALELLSAKAGITKGRCYELVGKYMK